MKNFEIRTAAFVVMLAVAVPVQAAYVTISDANSDFTVTYDDEQTGFFGPPVLSNNTIFFVPSTFSALSTNGEGEVIVNSTVQLILNATDEAIANGFSFDSFELLERGDYRLNGPGAGVDVEGQISVFDPNDAFNFAADFLTVDSDLTVNDGDLNPWIGTALIDEMAGWMPGSIDVNFTLENLLSAITTEAATSAFIEKKFSGVAISVNDSPIPVPAALWLFASALAGLGFIRQR